MRIPGENELFGQYLATMMEKPPRHRFIYFRGTRTPPRPFLRAARRVCATGVATMAQRMIGKAGEPDRACEYILIRTGG